MNDVEPQSEIAQAATQYPVDLHQQISEVAYRLYLERGGEHGSRDDDWYRAEKLISSSHER